MIKQIRNIAFITFIVLLPLTYQFPQGLREGQEQFFQYAMFCLLGLFLGNIWLGMFLILNVAMFIYSGENVGSSQLINVALGCVLFTISRGYFKDNSFLKVSKWLYVVLILNLLWMSLQLFGVDPINAPIDSTGAEAVGALRQPIGFMGIRMANAIFTCLIWPILASSNILLSLLLIVPLLVCYSSIAIVSLGSSMLFYTYYFSKRVFLALLLLIPILGSIYIYSDLKRDGLTFSSRFGMWSQVLYAALHNPIGYGPDSFRNINRVKNFNIVGDNDYNPAFETPLPNGNKSMRFFSISNDVAKINKVSNDYLKKSQSEGRFKVSFWDNPHNEYLQMLFEYGIIGFLLLIGFMYDLFSRFKKSEKTKELVVITCCLITFFVSSIGHFPLELARLAYLFPILLGAFYARTLDYA